MIDGVPTAEELLHQGLARRTPDNKIQILDEGHALLGQKLREASQRNGRHTAEQTRKLIEDGKAAIAATTKKKDKK